MRLKLGFILLSVTHFIFSQLRLPYPDFNRFLSYSHDFHQTALLSDTTLYSLTLQQKSRSGPLDNIGLSYISGKLKIPKGNGAFDLGVGFTGENEGKYIHYNQLYFNLAYQLSLTKNMRASIGVRSLWNQNILTSSISTRSENAFNLGSGVGLELYGWRLHFSYHNFLNTALSRPSFQCYSLDRSMVLNSIASLEFLMLHRQLQSVDNNTLAQLSLLLYQKVAVGFVYEYNGGLSFFLEGRRIGKNIPIRLFGLYKTTLLTNSSSVFNHFEIGLAWLK